MPTDPVALVSAYIHAVGNKQFDRLLDLLAPDMEFGGPNVRATHSAQELVTGLRRLTRILDRNEIKQIFVTADEAVVIYDFITDTPIGAVPSVEWLTLRDGRIQSSRLIFDRQRWPEVLQALQARVGPN
jgi:ketosteroid isomerase-like protein